MQGLAAPHQATYHQLSRLGKLADTLRVWSSYKAVRLTDLCKR